MTWRRLGNLVRNLPRDCATNRATQPDVVTWGIPEQLMAAIHDLVAIGNWQWASAHVRKGQKLTPPKPIPRPGVTNPGEKRLGRPVSLAAARERLRRVNGR